MSSVTAFPLWERLHLAQVHQPVRAPVAQMLSSPGKISPGRILHAVHNFEMAAYRGKIVVILDLMIG